MQHDEIQVADTVRSQQEIEVAAVKEAFELQKTAFGADPYPDEKQRRDRLDRLKTLLDTYEDRFIQAINQDFGQRSAVETRMAEFLPVRAGIGHAKKHLKAWMRHRRVATDFLFWPGKNRLIPQPLGVVGIISPWNYPVQLALAPLVAALAAGNRAILKPSEFTPVFSAVLKEAIESVFSREEVAVVTGGVEVASAVSSLPLGHLLFTGSTHVGRIVAEAAAKNLTPTTLELGGKSPVILDSSVDLDKAVLRLVKGKLLNAGQTCIAPDYVFVPQSMAADFRDKLLETARKMYPTLSGNLDATAIITGQHFNRLTGLVEEAVAAGATVHTPYGPFNADDYKADRMMPLCVLSDVADGMRVMQEEIFGPILPVIPYSNLSEAIAYIRARPHPLALYWFGTDAQNKKQVLEETIAGGVTINDTLLHIAQENLPFGGVGESGVGAYHGQHGFDAMSHLKPVYTQPKFAATDYLTPPFTGLTNKILAFSNWRWRG